MSLTGRHMVTRMLLALADDKRSRRDGFGRRIFLEAVE